MVQKPQEWPRGDTPHPRSGAVAKRRYPMSKVRSISREETTHVQGKRNPSKMVGVEREHQRADRLKPQSLANLITWTTDLSNSVILSHAVWVIQDKWVMVERSDKMWSTGEGNGKPLQYSCFENSMNSIKRQKDRTMKDELPMSVGAQYGTGDQWRNKK